MTQMPNEGPADKQELKGAPGYLRKRGYLSNVYGRI